VRLAEAPSYGAPAVKFDRDCKGSQAYIELVDEVLSRNGLAATTS
jgi:chromosome partitioning protein